MQKKPSTSPGPSSAKKRASAKPLQVPQTYISVAAASAKVRKLASPTPGSTQVAHSATGIGGKRSPEQKPRQAEKRTNFFMKKPSEPMLPRKSPRDLKKPGPVKKTSRGRQISPASRSDSGCDIEQSPDKGINPIRLVPKQHINFAKV